MSTTGGGDPPHQEILPIVDRELPRGTVLRNVLRSIGIRGADDVSRKLKRAGIDLVPKGQQPSRAISLGSEPEPQPTIEVPAPTPSSPPPPPYTEDLKIVRATERSVWSFSRRRTGPTPHRPSIPWFAVKVLLRVALPALVACGFIGPARRTEPVKPPESIDTAPPVKAPPVKKEVPLFPDGICTLADGSACRSEPQR